MACQELEISCSIASYWLVKLGHSQVLFFFPSLMVDRTSLLFGRLSRGT